MSRRRPRINFARLSGPLPTWHVYKNGKYQGLIRGYRGKGAVLELLYVHPNPGSNTNPHLLGCESVNAAKRAARDLLDPAVGPNAP